MTTMNSFTLRALLALLPLGAHAATRVPESARNGRAVPARARANDNRVPAGTLRGTTLTLRLEARVAMWYPDGDDAPGAPIPSFAEEERAALIPGPLVRVRAGTTVDVTVRNTLADTLLVYGLHARVPGAATVDSALILAPGERRDVHLTLSAPGTYLYWGTTMRRAINFRTREDAQLTGAIVVDDATGPRPRDRILVLGMWSDTIHRAMTHRERVLGVINGRSWPHTERVEYAVGDTVRWRIINSTADLHPMHLHGFYFRVDSRGDSRRDTLYAGDDRRLAVTDNMEAGGTMSLTWVPERAGNWLFHCHVPEHFGPRGSLGVAPASVSAGAADHADHAKGGMNGLVMGIAVRGATAARMATAPTTASPALSGDARSVHRVRLLVRENRGSSGTMPFYGYTLHESGAEPPPDSGLGVGPVLDLLRGQRAEITVVNRLREPTAVHWHGIELESYYDGVPGFSGATGRVTPLIAPGDSFTVRFVPPRAGTFIYHTHANEERQQLAGLAGAIVVRDAGSVRDTATDIPIVLTAPSDFAEQRRSVVVNGKSAPMQLVVGRTYRLRFIQMSVSRAALWAELLRDSTHVQWKLLAKDGADLPMSARAQVNARVRLGIGETYDVEFTPTVAGDLRLDLRVGAPPPRNVLMTSIPVRVRP